MEIEDKRKATEMSGTVREAVNLLEILPEQEQDFALEFIKKPLRIDSWQGQAGNPNNGISGILFFS